jgi:hypothetical protein
MVNDGLANSTPNNITIVGVITQDSAPIQLLTEALAVIDELAEENFKPGHKRKSLTNKILAIVEDLDQGDIRHAVEKLSSDVVAKTDGCAAEDIPDQNDWLVNCAAQGELYPLLFGALAALTPQLQQERDGDHRQHGHYGSGHHCIRHALEHSNSRDEFVQALMLCIRSHWHGNGGEHGHDHNDHQDHLQDQGHQHDESHGNRHG